MRIFLSFLLLVFLTSCVEAEDKPVQCLNEQVTIADLKEQNAQLFLQALQLQAQQARQAQEAAKAEGERLKKLLPKPDEKKK